MHIEPRKKLSLSNRTPVNYPFKVYDGLVCVYSVTCVREPLVKDCKVEGPITCSTEYQSECETIQHEHQVGDFFNRRSVVINDFLR
jgi:hypothetical protein